MQNEKIEYFRVYSRFAPSFLKKSDGKCVEFMEIAFFSFAILKWQCYNQRM